jgi:hypothetical protein
VTDAAPEPSAELPEGVLAVRLGPGANCSSAGSAIDVLFYGSAIVGALAVALAAAFPPRPPDAGNDDGQPPDPASDPARDAERVGATLGDRDPPHR